MWPQGPQSNVYLYPVIWGHIFHTQCVIMVRLLSIYLYLNISAIPQFLTIQMYIKSSTQYFTLLHGSLIENDMNLYIMEIIQQLLLDGQIKSITAATQGSCYLIGFVTEVIFFQFFPASVIKWVTSINQFNHCTGVQSH